jgi:hypothetical protein
MASLRTSLVEIKTLLATFYNCCLLLLLMARTAYCPFRSTRNLTCNYRTCFVSNNTTIYIPPETVEKQLLSNRFFPIFEDLSILQIFSQDSEVILF